MLRARVVYPSVSVTSRGSFGVTLCAPRRRRFPVASREFVVEELDTRQELRTLPSPLEVSVRAVDAAPRHSLA